MDYKVAIDTLIGGRTENQDFAAKKDTKFGLLIIVCDGVGGSSGGAIASQIATRIILDEFDAIKEKGDSSFILGAAIQKANTIIYQRSLKESNLRGMGTTVAALLLTPSEALIAHVGDSRIYHIRNGKLVFKTKDHSIVQNMVDRGELQEERARFHPDSNQITRALGVRDKVMIDISSTQYEKGDYFLLTSDGIHGEIDQDDLLSIVKKRKDANAIVSEVLAVCDQNGRASKLGEHDNLTIGVVEITSSSTRIIGRGNVINILVLTLSVIVLCILIYLHFTVSPQKEKEVTTNTMVQKEKVQKMYNMLEDHIILCGEVLKTRPNNSEIKGFSDELKNIQGKYFEKICPQGNCREIDSLTNEWMDISSTFETLEKDIFPKIYTEHEQTTANHK
ncbi:PP2C family protein-serine/threonine phosphatase [Haliscomenobacter sp.]|uniref:PP2C family protein-serine/threonine phosphatase n=1 Tax=Haliscomenobacter sp. TaxID=2717303 RepID=UPI003BAAC501